ncbi:uncharacterized protein B0T23DRAFT_146125 [Neurospora hispaniola]|uniref:Uncharacterized protein n=1 Tax=Neurospora hispaniola TaxID=588809 RepID=A0AAJ0I7X4_9PEZI|nr:hypothetical protein B0T23DRAFT_146125 [Neurospora hispaniola]
MRRTIFYLYQVSPYVITVFVVFFSFFFSLQFTQVLDVKKIGLASLLLLSFCRITLGCDVMFSIASVLQVVQ